MSQQTPYNPYRGLPRGTPAWLRRALAKELRRMGATYAECVAEADAPTDPETVLKIVRLWNSLDPSQLAAWDDYARKENMRGADPAHQN